MATKLDILRQIVEELGAVFPDLKPGSQIYLAPRIMSVPGMAPLEIQVCEAVSRYEDIEGGCRSEDFNVLVGIFRDYRLDSDGRHAKAIADLTLSIFVLKETAIKALDGNFLLESPGQDMMLLTRPLVIKAESEVTEAGDGRLLKTLSFLAGLNSTMGEEE